MGNDTAVHTSDSDDNGRSLFGLGSGGILRRFYRRHHVACGYWIAVAIVVTGIFVISLMGSSDNNVEIQRCIETTTSTTILSNGRVIIPVPSNASVIICP